MMATPTSAARTPWGLRAALVFGAVLWLALLVTGFIASGGWKWGMSGSIGHIENYMIALWFVTLVLAPLLAVRDPLRQTAAIQVYLLGVLAIVLSAIRGERLALLSDGVPFAAAILSIGLVLLAHPKRWALWRL